MPESITHGKTTIAADAEEATIEAHAFAGKGLCQISLETTPADARLNVVVLDAGRWQVERRSHHGEAIEIRYRIQYGLGQVLRAEADERL